MLQRCKGSRGVNKHEGEMGLESDFSVCLYDGLHLQVTEMWV